MPLPERELIERIRRNLKPTRGRTPLVKGIGDDCAVLRLPADRELLVTTDFSLEGVHFRREWHPAEVVGQRCLVRGLSDIAAMGGDPVAAFLSLALPAALDQKWVDGFIGGFSALAKKFGVSLAGGDTAQSPAFDVAPALRRLSRGRPASALGRESTGAILADVVVLGSVPRGQAALRSGAKVGDDIYVTGRLGTGAAALNRLIAGEDAASLLRDKSALKHFRPLPRIEIGRYLRERGLASAMIDISDGLSTDLAHICEESGVSAWIAEEGVPIAKGATLDDALHGGDEYELIFTARADKHANIPKSLGGVPITWIGTVTKSDSPARGTRTGKSRAMRPSRNSAQHRVWLVNNERGRSELTPKGWEHFRSDAQTNPNRRINK